MMQVEKKYENIENIEKVVKFKNVEKIIKKKMKLPNNKILSIY